MAKQKPRKRVKNNPDHGLRVFVENRFSSANRIPKWQIWAEKLKLQVTQLGHKSRNSVCWVCDWFRPTPRMSCYHNLSNRKFRRKLRQIRRQLRANAVIWCKLAGVKPEPRKTLVDRLVEKLTKEMVAKR